jgi:hypothetical protein
MQLGARDAEVEVANLAINDLSQQIEALEAAAAEKDRIIGDLEDTLAREIAAKEKVLRQAADVAGDFTRRIYDLEEVIKQKDRKIRGVTVEYGEVMPVGNYFGAWGGRRPAGACGDFPPAPDWNARWPASDWGARRPAGFWPT